MYSTESAPKIAPPKFEIPVQAISRRSSGCLTTNARPSRISVVSGSRSSTGFGYLLVTDPAQRERRRHIAQ